MSSDTYWRARTIVEDGGVVLCADSSPIHFHFLVKQRSGKWCDVYKTKNSKTRLTEWSCCAMADKGKWSCSLYRDDQSKPFCSHTRACELFMKGEKSE